MTLGCIFASWPLGGWKSPGRHFITKKYINSMSTEPLSRDEFKAAVFKRDGGRCVLCSDKAVDAHHIIDRSLWENGGYYTENGVSLCEKHHLDAEMTLISCTELRDAAGIKTVLLPDHFYADERYDHWGNIIQPSGMRIKGELFGQENVQRILKQAGVLGQFLEFVKYPRTYHAPYSENLQNDDRMHTDISFFDGKEVIVTEKRDGENSNLYSNYMHARSIDSRHHDSRSWLKKLHGSISHEIPKDFRICGENLYAKHSIHYRHLKSYFEVYFIWNEANVALSWDETVEWCALLDIEHVPVIYRGLWDKYLIHETFVKYQEKSLDPVEGYVVRIASRISFKDYRLSTLKWVKKGFVQTDEHWMEKEIIKNEISKILPILS